MFGIAVLLAVASNAVAGMPSPLPSDDELVRVFRLNDTVDQRVQVISFFVVGLLLCAAVVRWLWNYAGRELPLPRLGYGKALAGVVLWGLLFLIVLTMISGARELMTPGVEEAGLHLSTCAARRLIERSRSSVPASEAIGSLAAIVVALRSDAPGPVSESE